MPDIKKILIVTPVQSARLDYICHHISEFFVDVEVLSGQVMDSSTSYDVTIGYGMSGNTYDISIPMLGLLSQKGIQSQDISIDYKDELPCFFTSSSLTEDFGFDLLAMIFYLLSRYEEYDLSDTDQHGRYKSKNSLAGQYGFLEVALVDRWLIRLRDKISETTGVTLKIKSWSANQGSIDIDMPYAYRYKGAKAYIGILRDLLTGSWDTAIARCTYWFTNRDPFDTYDYLIDHFRKCKSTPYVFILNRYRQPHDENHLAQTDELSSIIKRLSVVSKIGIHPSYSSHESQALLHEEIDSLKDTIDIQGRSRQHFIKMSMPATYRGLVDAGIKEDHSLMYPDQVGYRASTSRPFRWYDIGKEEMTTLMIHPYAVMDVTLRYYMSLSPEESIAAIKKLAREAHGVHGTLGWIWHNSSLERAYGWLPWKPVFEHLILH